MKLQKNQPTTLKDISLEDINSSFISSQDIRSSSRRLYSKTLNQFFKWVQDSHYNFNNLTRVEILEYKEDLLKSEKTSLTVASYINTVRRFYEWTESNKIYPNIARGIKTPVRKQQYKKQPLTQDQAIALLEYFKSRNKRDFAIINLLLRTGLRTIEVKRALIKDLVFKGSQSVLMVKGKGRDDKDNFVILTPKAHKAILDYLSTRKNYKLSDPLFTSKSNKNRGSELSTRTISQVAKNGLKAIGLNDRVFTAHSLRHTTAVNILRAGGSLEMVQFTMRHTNPATTQIYTSTIDEERRLKNSGEALLDSVF